MTAQARTRPIDERKRCPMWFEPDDFHFFWLSRWMQPLRSACPWLSPPVRQKAQKKKKIPKWLRPVYVQHWIRHAVAERQAWLAAHPNAAPYRFADSMPCWSKTAAMPYEERRMHKLKDSDLFWLFDVDLERALRIMQADPAEIGEDRWTQAALGTCGHLAQAYREFQRRCGTRRARSLIREELWIFKLLSTKEIEEEEERNGAPPLTPALPVQADSLPAPVS